MNRQIETEVSGFIPIFEIILHYYKDIITASVFGRVWNYCNMYNKVCNASLERIGSDLELNKATVMRHIKKLVTDGFLIDTTPELRNVPHTYKDGGLISMKGSISAKSEKVLQRVTPTVAQSNKSVAESKLIKQYNTINKQYIKKDKKFNDNKPTTPLTTKLKPVNKPLMGAKVPEITNDKDYWDELPE